ncbi:MAG TPA: GTPase Era [Micropepsaceae bacterium]|nr:GTPase Era [Micropepsaceae bacterium]
MTQENSQTRFGVAAVIGAPNAGKSTLVNALTGAKITIVSRKVQTTRMRVRGVMMAGTAQIVLVDTPGIFSPRRRLDKAMVRAAWGSLEDADATLLVVDASLSSIEEAEALAKAIPADRPHVALVLNKTDLAPKERLLTHAAALNAVRSFEKTFMISAEKGGGVDAVRDWLASHAKPGPWHYPEDQAGDLPSRLLAAEITREHVFDRLHDELPYESHVVTTAWEPRKDGSIRIEQTILIARDSQKGIAIGKGGQTLKAIGQAARRDMEEGLGTRVHLFLNVKVDPQWSQSKEIFGELGLEWE